MDQKTLLKEKEGGRVTLLILCTVLALTGLILTFVIPWCLGHSLHGTFQYEDGSTTSFTLTIHKNTGSPTTLYLKEGEIVKVFQCTPVNTLTKQAFEREVLKRK